MWDLRPLTGRYIGVIVQFWMNLDAHWCFQSRKHIWTFADMGSSMLGSYLYIRLQTSSASPVVKLTAHPWPVPNFYSHLFTFVFSSDPCHWVYMNWSWGKIRFLKNTQVLTWGWKKGDRYVNIILFAWTDCSFHSCKCRKTRCLRFTVLVRST